MFENVTCFPFHTKTTFSATENRIFWKQSLKCLVTSFFSSSLEGEYRNFSKTLGSGWCHFVMSTRFATEQNGESQFRFQTPSDGEKPCPDGSVNNKPFGAFSTQILFSEIYRWVQTGLFFCSFVCLTLEQIPNVKTWLFCTVRYDTGNLLQMSCKMFPRRIPV